MSNTSNMNTWDLTQNFDFFEKASQTLGTYEEVIRRDVGFSYLEPMWAWKFSTRPTKSMLDSINHHCGFFALQNEDYGRVIKTFQMNTLV